MDHLLKSVLKKQIQTFLEKTPQETISKIVNWLRAGDIPGRDRVDRVKIETLRSFVKYQKNKFMLHGLCVEYLKGNGGKQIPKRKQIQVKGIMVNKDRRSSRAVASQVGLSQSSVINIMKRSGCKAYHKY